MERSVFLNPSMYASTVFAFGVMPLLVSGEDASGVRNEALDLCRDRARTRGPREVSAGDRDTRRLRRLAENGVDVPGRDHAVRGEGNAENRLDAPSQGLTHVHIEDGSRAA